MSNLASRGLWSEMLRPVPEVIVLGWAVQVLGGLASEMAGLESLHLAESMWGIVVRY